MTEERTLINSVEAFMQVSEEQQKELLNKLLHRIKSQNLTQEANDFLEQQFQSK